MRALTFCSYNINELSTFMDYQTTVFCYKIFFPFLFPFIRHRRLYESHMYCQWRFLC